jgi:cyclic-di-GMP-binding protein
MPSFDIVSQVDLHELRNGVDQANREFSTRFDFKGSGARVDQEELTLTLHAANEFQIKQMQEVLMTKLAKRSVDIGCLQMDEIEASGQQARQRITVRQGIDDNLARKIVKLVKDSKLKVQTAIQGEQVRVTGKKRDDLQEVIATLRKADLGLPLQYINFRD